MDTIRKNTTEIDMNVNVRRITWGAIFAGTLIMLVTMMLLSLLGIGIGIGSINPISDNEPMQGIGTGAIIWWVLSNLIAVFTGGFVTGKLTNSNYKGSGLLHGLVAWSLYTVISFFILTTTVGAIFSGVGSMVTKSVSSIGSGVGSLIENTMGKEKGDLNIKGALNKIGINEKDVNVDQLMADLKQLVFKNGKINKDIQPEDVERVIAQNSKLSAEQAGQLSNEINKIYQQALAQWEDVKLGIEKANDVAAKAAIWSFVALLIGAILAGVGGKVGEKRNEDAYVADRR